MTAAVLLEPETGPASLSERAYRQIRRLIVTLELPPGALVSEAELAERLGIGRTPVREAVRSLAAERLIEVLPRRGMFVADVDPRDLSALAEVREELEPFAARLAATRRTAADVATIEGLLAEITSGNTTDMRGLIEMDQRIHHHVYRCTHNAVLAELCERNYMHALRIWFLALDRVTELEAAVTEHRDLLDAIRDRDADRAAEVMRAHIVGFESAVRQAI